MAVPTPRRKQRSAFTLVELLVVIAIIGVLMALILPAVQRVRASAQRLACANNLRQIGIAFSNYNTQAKAFPSGGEGFDPTTGNIVFSTHSLFTKLLPHIEEVDAFDRGDLSSNAYYLRGANATSPPTPLFGQKAVRVLLCTANYLRPSTGLDSAGYGYTDYGATVWTNIADSSTPGSPALGAMMPGALCELPGTANTAGGSDTNIPQEQIRDGLTYTIAVAEDGGRLDPVQVGTIVGSSGTQYDWAFDTSPPPPHTSTTPRFYWRWAEPNNAIGVGLPANNPNFLPATVYNTGYPGAVPAGARRLINNNKTPQGGPSSSPAAVGDCPWSSAPNPLTGYGYNCGPNHMIFSFHSGGANVVFMDGHVTFIDESIDPQTLKRLVTRADPGNPPSGDF